MIKKIKYAFVVAACMSMHACAINGTITGETSGGKFVIPISIQK